MFAEFTFPVSNKDVTSYLPIIILTTVLFTLLAAVLLVPIYRFLKKEEEASLQWTPENVAMRMREHERKVNGNLADQAGGADASGAVGRTDDDHR